MQSNSGGCCLFAPFIWLGQLILWIIGIVGRLAAAFIGFLLMILGITLCLTIIGAIVGIPLIIFGVMLMVRSIS